MSRLNKTAVNDLGLSRQSSRTYNVINRKWSSNLDKTLRQLDNEHKTNLSKILNERFDLKNARHALKSESELLAKRDKTESLPIINFTASDSFMECASLEMENAATEKSCDVGNPEIVETAAKSLDGSHKPQASQNVLRLPCIIEETLSQRHPSRSAKSEHRLPPLPAEALPSRSRKHSDWHQEKPACRTRQRSSTLPVGGTAEDRWRRIRSPFSTFSDSGSPRKQKRAQDDDLRAAEDESGKLSSTWPTDLENCRYLRRRAVSSPDRLDVKSIFRD